MTDQKMPDEIFIAKTKLDKDTYLLSFKSKHEPSTSYTRTDLYTAVCAERDALRALCEGMAAYVRCAQVNISARLDNMTEPKKEVAINHAWHILAQALAAYKTHKEQTK